MKEGLEFDPGFAPYIMAFQGTVEYLYTDINRFKNLSQRKMRFKQYYKKILDIFNNNLGFYIGCLMWAAYVIKQEEQPILNNHCLGNKYNEDENTSETDFMITFTELFPRDIKYFLGETYTVDEKVIKVLNTYKEFLTINRGFIETKLNTDIKLPENIQTNDVNIYKEKIEETIKYGDLSKLIEYKDYIFTEETL